MMQSTPTVALLSASQSSVSGIKLATYELEYWRSIHGEVMTHRNAAKNASSSRARPNKYAIETAKFVPWGPEMFGQNQKGMQAGQAVNTRVFIPTILTDAYIYFCNEVGLTPEANFYVDGIALGEAWHFTAWLAGTMASCFDAAQVHKQWTNRITEPYNSIKVIFTASQYANIWALRDHSDAQPEFRTLVQRMREVYENTEFKLLHPGEWHMPYIRQEDKEAAFKFLNEAHRSGTPLIHPSFPDRAMELQHLLLCMSAARCARTSYFGFDGTINIAKDLELCEQLAGSKPVHASPFEHQATPLPVFKLQTIVPTQEDPFGEAPTVYDFFGAPEAWGCLKGWMTFRQTIPENFVPG